MVDLSDDKVVEQKPWLKAELDCRSQVNKRWRVDKVDRSVDRLLYRFSAKPFDGSAVCRLRSRRSFIFPDLLSIGIIRIYNGRDYKSVLPGMYLNQMAGCRFGEFALTKRIGSSIHIKRQRTRMMVSRIPRKPGIVRKSRVVISRGHRHRSTTVKKKNIRKAGQRRDRGIKRTKRVVRR